jgi:hypothetical protein
MTITNQTRREIMLTAWGFRRDDPSRPFADCLRGAWRFVRAIAKEAKALVRRARGGRRVAFSPSPISSPIQRATSTNRHPGRADWHAARTTSRIGA